MTTILINDSGEVRYMPYVPEEPKKETYRQKLLGVWTEYFYMDLYHDAIKDYQSDLEKAKRESIPFDRPEDIQRIADVIFETHDLPKDNSHAWCFNCKHLAAIDKFEWTKNVIAATDGMELIQLVLICPICKDRNCEGLFPHELN